MRLSYDTLHLLSTIGHGDRTAQKLLDWTHEQLGHHVTFSYRIGCLQAVARSLVTGNIVEAVHGP